MARGKEDRGRTDDVWATISCRSVLCLPPSARRPPTSALRSPAITPTLGAEWPGLEPAKDRSFMMRDPYEVLGVGKNADAAAIKSAYRRLAKKLHPDANKSDPKTAQRFAEINSAYEILGEEKKRKAYDAGEIDAEGKPRFQGFHGFGGPRGGAGAGGPGAHFETFSFGA